MDLELDGRTAAVIGASSGIGPAVAGVLAAKGCDVAVTYRSSCHGAERVAAEVRAHRRRAWVVPLDLGRPESVTEAAGVLSAQVGGLDAVVLCAGHNVVTPFGRITADGGTPSTASPTTMRRPACCYSVSPPAGAWRRRSPSWRVRSPST